MSNQNKVTMVKKFDIKSSGGLVKAIKWSDESITYPDHNPNCIIYQIGVEHCNCNGDIEAEWN